MSAQRALNLAQHQRTQQCQEYSETLDRALWVGVCLGKRDAIDVQDLADFYRGGMLGCCFSDVRELLGLV